MGPGVPAAHRAEALSYFKARAVAGRLPSGVVLAADTVVSCDGEIHGKPMDAMDARRILRQLIGQRQEIITGVTLLEAATRDRLIAHDVTVVWMRDVPDATLEAYLDSGAWIGKAGAYGIQDRGDAFVERIEGSFTNVVGLPMELVAAMLSQWGFQAQTGVAKPAQT